jgi:hypothetical protein
MLVYSMFKVIGLPVCVIMPVFNLTSLDFIFITVAFIFLFYEVNFLKEQHDSKNYLNSSISCYR